MAVIGNGGRFLRFFRKYEYNGVEYTVSNDEYGRIVWSFDKVIEVPFNGDAVTVADAHAKVKEQIDRMKGAR